MCSSVAVDATQQFSSSAHPIDSSAILHEVSVIVSIVSNTVQSQFKTDENDVGFTGDDIAAVAPSTVGVGSSHVKGNAPRIAIGKVIGVDSEIVIPLTPPGIVATTLHRQTNIVLHHLPILASHTGHDVPTAREGHVIAAADSADEVAVLEHALLAPKSSRLTLVTFNDYVPDEVGATPLELGSDAPRALSSAVLIQTAFNPVPIQSGHAGEPSTAATEVPSAYDSSTIECDVGNEGDSVGVQIIIISRPDRHAISGDRFTDEPVIEPCATPPVGRDTGSPTTQPVTGSPIVTTTVTG